MKGLFILNRKLMYYGRMIVFLTALFHILNRDMSQLISESVFIHYHRREVKSIRQNIFAFNIFI